MRFALLLLAAWLLLMVLPTEAAAPAAGGPYAARWKEINALLAKDQTESAQKLVLEVYQKARARQQTADYVRALVYRLQLLGQREEDANVKGIRMLEEDLRTATPLARLLLHSLLAEQYHNYLRQNRYRLYDRTAVAPAADSLGADDLQTWDAARLAAQVVRHYRRSVDTEAERQQQTSLRELGRLATPAEGASRQLRPTLYDLLAHRAILGLNDDELYLTRPAEQFRFKDEQLFGTNEVFAQLPLVAPVADSLYGPLYALRTWQQLTAFRLRDKRNLAALADVERLRLAFVYARAVFPNHTAAYIAALRRAQTRYEALPAWADFQADLVEMALRQRRITEAVQLTQAAVRRFPKSVGASRAQSLTNNILLPELDVQTAEVELPGEAMLLSLSYRNLKQVYAFAWPIPASLALRLQFSQLEKPRQTYLRYSAGKPASTWSMTLPGPNDYRRHRAELAGPALPVGHYLVAVSTAAEQPLKERQGVATAYALVTVSELAAMQRAAPEGDGPDFWAVNRRTGQPMAGVAVQPWFRRYTPQGKPQMVAGALQSTPATGNVKMPALYSRGSELSGLLLSKGADSLIMAGYTGSEWRSDERGEGQDSVLRRAYVYSDRAIYRPGQTLYFKGIVAEEKQGRSQVLPNLLVWLRLLDVNGQQVLKLPFTTSNFGSFNGSIRLPTNLLNGRMQLVVSAGESDDEDGLGSQDFAVEDYKRPTFSVTLDPLAGTPKLGDTLSVRGTATAYAGPAVDGATVQYRVVRRTAWPMFARHDWDFGFGDYHGRRPYYPGDGAQQQVATGTATTDAQGRFRISFTAAVPAEAVNEEPGGDPDEDSYRWPGPVRPAYVFEVTADVTDSNGETRSAERGIPLGGPALNLSLSGPQRVNQQQLVAGFKLRSQNAAGEPAPATGTLHLYRLTPPGRTLRPRLWAPPDVPGLREEQHRQMFPLDAWQREDDPSKWPRTVVAEWPFDTKKNTELPEVTKALAAQTPGAYVLEARSIIGSDTAQAELGFTLYNPTAKQTPLPLPEWLVSLQDSVAPGQAAQVLIGTGLDEVRARLEVESRGRLVRAEWLTLRREQRLISLPTTATDSGPLYVRLVFVHANRFYQEEVTVQVAPPLRQLRVALSTFRDKLSPGEKETWRLTIRNSQNQPAAAELLASLYDQSLDYFQPHSFERPMPRQPYFGPRFGWSAQLGVRSWPLLFMMYGNDVEQRQYQYPELRLTFWAWQTDPNSRRENRKHRVVRQEMAANGTAAGRRKLKAGVRESMAVTAAPAAMELSDEEKSAGFTDADNAWGAPEPAAAANAAPARAGSASLAAVPVRSDFRETALWAPAVRTNTKGEIVLEFQMPEAVTRWQLLTLAHTPDLQTGMLARQLVTQKQLMVTPNAPRFFREGDQLRLSAKISNLTTNRLGGDAQLLLFDARTNQPLDKQLLTSGGKVKFNAAARQSTTVAWELRIPAGLEAVTYRVVAQAKDFSDGEENTLPVLPNRLLVLEAMPLTVRGNTVQEFNLKKLTGTTSPTRRHQSLTLELTSNPAWYAVQSLPYLMEYPFECSEQLFSRLYANTLAAHIAEQNPRIRPMLAEWQRAAAGGKLQAWRSKLEQNQELKALLLQETPWVREGQSETERMRRLAELFNEPRLQAETERAVQKLTEQQSPSGAFPWFKQMPDNPYITQLIVAGFGRLRRLGAWDVTQDARTAEMLGNAVRYLDRQIAEDYARLRRRKELKLSDDHLGDLTLHTLYARSFWTAELPLSAEAQPAYAYYREQAAKYWPQRNRYLQGLAALVLHRAGQARPVRDIMEALRQNALKSDELGMYWKDVRAGFYWQQAPVETQAQLIEAFTEAANDPKDVEEMQIWLLSHKRTHHWESTRATADACYALLLQSPRNWLEPAPPLRVSLGGQAINTTDGAQAGTGYLKRSFPAAEVQPAMGKVRVQKTGAGVAWGGLYWQYFEQLDQITRADNAPLTLTRQLFRETPGAAGPVLTPVAAAAPLKVGEVLVVRLVLKTDRELEFMHLKDTRAAGLELINQTSGYRYQQGLGYYESPRDAATNFFVDQLPRGTHVFEYRLRAAQAGDFSSGISQVQCLYAPEFASHSAGQRLRIGTP